MSRVAFALRQLESWRVIEFVPNVRERKRIISRLAHVVVAPTPGAEKRRTYSTERVRLKTTIPSVVYRIHDTQLEKFRPPNVPQNAAYPGGRVVRFEPHAYTELGSDIWAVRQNGGLHHELRVKSQHRSACSAADLTLAAPGYWVGQSHT